MTESDNVLAERAVNALVAIAEHMGVLATMALTNAAQTETKPKRAKGRKNEPLHVVGGSAVEPQAEAPVEVEQEPDAPVEPTEEERKEKFAALKAALKGSLALHGEEETRTRLQYGKFSEVPFDAIDETIERLEA
jgi:hypothetical protein